jgi:hypothetical protein
MTHLIFVIIIYLFSSLKGSPVHVAPSCAGSGEGSDHFGSYVHTIFLV